MLFLSGIFLFIVPVIERNSLDHKKEMIRELANSAGTIIARFENDEQRGLLPREEAQRLAIEQITGSALWPADERLFLDQRHAAAHDPASEPYGFNRQGCVRL